MLNHLLSSVNHSNIERRTPTEYIALSMNFCTLTFSTHELRPWVTWVRFFFPFLYWLFSLFGTPCRLCFGWLVPPCPFPVPFFGSFTSAFWSWNRVVSLRLGAYLPSASLLRIYSVCHRLTQHRIEINWVRKRWLAIWYMQIFPTDMHALFISQQTCEIDEAGAWAWFILPVAEGRASFRRQSIGSGERPERVTARHAELAVGSSAAIGEVWNRQRGWSLSSG